MAQSLELCFHTQSFITKAKLCAATSSVLQQWGCYTKNAGAIMYYMSTELQKGILLHRASGAASFGTEHCFLHRALLLYTELFFEDKVADVAQRLEFCFHTQSFITKAKLCTATMGMLHQKCRCNHVLHEHRAPERHTRVQGFRICKF